MPDDIKTEGRKVDTSKVDFGGLDDAEVTSLMEMDPPGDTPFKINKLGHAVIMCQDVDESVRFYTQVLGFKVSDVYPESMAPGRMVFMRFGDDHHGIGLVGQAPGKSPNHELHHLAFEVATIDEVFKAREHLEKHGVHIAFDGRRRAGCQVSVEFDDPDGHHIEIFWNLDKVDWDGKARPASEWTPAQTLEEAVDHAPPGQDTTLADPSLRRD